MKSLLNQMPKGGSPVREIRSPGSVQGVPLALIERSSREVSLLGPKRSGPHRHWHSSGVVRDARAVLQRSVDQSYFTCE